LEIATIPPVACNDTADNVIAMGVGLVAISLLEPIRTPHKSRTPAEFSLISTALSSDLFVDAFVSKRDFIASVYFIASAKINILT